MDSLNPLQTIIDYKVAVGADEVNKLLAEGYELEGAPHFSVEGTIDYDVGVENETVVVRQVMVKREPFTAAKYLKLLKGVILMQGQLQDFLNDPSSLFTKTEIREFAEAMGQEVDEEELAQFKDG